MIGCLRTRVRKQPIIALYLGKARQLPLSYQPFEHSTVLCQRHIIQKKT